MNLIQKKSFVLWFGSVFSGLLFSLPICSKPETIIQQPPVFSEVKAGEYEFNTGVVKGKLRQNGQSIGLLPVTYVSTNQNIASGTGLLNHYRVFTKGKRYGYGARRWPSTASLNQDGSVDVLWEAQSDRPFDLKASYRWLNENTLELVTSVYAKQALTGFEVFVASYFTPAFKRSYVHTQDSSGKPSFVSAERTLGDWLVFPKNKQAEALIADGRWELKPHPLNWRVVSNYGLPIAVRQDPVSGLSVSAMSTAADCFGVFTPYGEEKHYSHYLSLFGKDIPQGGVEKAYSKLIFMEKFDDKEIVEEAKLIKIE